MADLIEIQIDGITGFDPLYVPLEDLREFRSGYAETVAGKIGNDPDKDIYTNLSTWPLMPPDGFENGAFRQNADPAALQYWLPTGSGVDDTPVNGTLPWTLHSGMILCPPAFVDQSGSFAFVQFAQYKGSTYGLDAKNNKVFRWNGSAWVDAVAGLTAAVTELYTRGDGQNSNMIVAQASGKARIYNGSSWSDWAPRTGVVQCHHLCQVGSDIWFSVGNALYNARNDNSPKRFIGSADSPVNRMLWYQNYILVGKPDGLYMVDPRPNTDTPTQILLDFTTPDASNCKTMVIHNGMVWFNVGEKLLAWNGKQFLSQTFAEFEGNGTKPFNGGRVLGASSDGERLYLILRVLTNDATPVYHYYLIAYNGTGFHPILHYQTASAPTPEVGGVLMDTNNQLRYSVGAGYTGYVLTNGEIPMASASSPTAYFGVNTGLRTGWQTFGRSALAKWFKEMRYSVRDYNVTGRVRFYFRKWGDAAWTHIGSSRSGSHDNETIGLPPDTGSEIGITATKIDFKVEFYNTALDPLDAWYLRDWHISGIPCFPSALTGTLNAWIYPDLDGARSSSDDVLDGLKAALAQEAPVKITHPDGSTFYAKFYPVPNGDSITEYTSDDGIRVRKFTIAFREVS